MVEIVETELEIPICPHCQKELTSIKSTKIKSIFGMRYIYFCTFCKKVLGISHRKGFWMG